MDKYRTLAKEMNERMGLDPEIDVELPEGELIEELKRNAAELQSDDDQPAEDKETGTTIPGITKAGKATLQELGVGPWLMTEKKETTKKEVSKVAAKKTEGSKKVEKKAAAKSDGASTDYSKWKEGGLCYTILHTAKTKKPKTKDIILEAVGKTELGKKSVNLQSMVSRILAQCVRDKVLVKTDNGYTEIA